MSKKVRISRANVKLNAYAIVRRAVDEGAAYGVQRAYKYTDKPSRDAIAESCAEYVMNAISDVIDWGDP